MSTRKDYDYPRAPITVELGEGGPSALTIDFEVGADLDTVDITVEVPDYSSFRNSTTDRTFWLSLADWQAVVEHIASDLAAGGVVPAGHMGERSEASNPGPEHPVT